MRTCEAGACTKPAVYRGPRDAKGAAAWCEEHVPHTELGPMGNAHSVKFMPPGVVPIPGAQQEVKP